MGEERPPPHRRFSLFWGLHPALLIHLRVQAYLVSRLGPDLRRDYWELWAQEVIDCHSLSKYGMSRLLQPAAPAPCFEDWDALDRPVLETITVENSEDQEDQADQESDQDLPDSEQAGTLKPWDPWAGSRAVGIEFSPEFPQPNPWDLNWKVPGFGLPPRVCGAFRIHILMLEEW